MQDAREGDIDFIPMIRPNLISKKPDKAVYEKNPSWIDTKYPAAFFKKLFGFEIWEAIK